jgi:hypothetical protein
MRKRTIRSERENVRSFLDINTCDNCQLPTCVLRHRGLVRVPLLLEDDVPKLKHGGDHLQHGCKHRRRYHKLTMNGTHCSVFAGIHGTVMNMESYNNY